MILSEANTEDRFTASDLRRIARELSASGALRDVLHTSIWSVPTQQLGKQLLADSKQKSRFRDAR